MIASKKEMKIRTFSKTNKQSSSKRSLSSVHRATGLFLVLLLLVYTVVFFQSLVGLRNADDEGIVAATASENNNRNKAIIANTNIITTGLSSSNHHNRQRQQQQQQLKPKDTELDVPLHADARLPSSSVGIITSTAKKSIIVRSDDSLNPKQQQQQQSDHQKQQAEVQVLQSKNEPWTSPAASKSPPLLLNVLFYIYEELLWLDDAIVVQDSNNTTTPPVIIIPVEEWVLHRQEIKHSEDWWFAKAALSHPQRTLDPNQAKIFVVPGLFNTLIHLVVNYNQRKCYRAKLCHGGRCGLELLNYTNDYLGRSTWFQRNNGSDHFLVASHYRSDWHHRDNPNLFNCHVIGMEDRQSNSNDRLHLPSTYVGQPCPLATVKKHDFAFVGDIVTPSPMFDHRRKMCKWMMNTQQEFNQTAAAAAASSPNITMFTMPFCGTGPQCPTLAEARYGFHLRGDTNGANRLIDTILSGTVPIFTTARQYQVLPEWIDWRIMSMHINIRKTSKPNFLSNVAKVVNDMSKKEYAEKLEHVIRNRDLVDWTTIIPFDQYMYALSCQLWPQDEMKRRATLPGGKITTPYSAYAIPRPGHFRFPQVPRKPGPLPQDRNIMTSTTGSSEKVA